MEVMLSSVTDAYQPLERTYRLTRACLEVFAAAACGQLWRSDAWLKISILTKSDLILQDLDVLQDLPGLEVGMTVTAVDDAVSRLYEPGAPLGLWWIALIRILPLWAVSFESLRPKRRGRCEATLLHPKPIWTGSGRVPLRPQPAWVCLCTSCFERRAARAFTRSAQ
ncbi:MAG: hypothetical protein IMW99_06155 [Firmicutes bacterium]|nr:hypothetical protein [Bacillota bacterium]